MNGPPSDRALIRYIRKMAGRGLSAPAAPPAREMFWSWLGAVLGIGLVGTLHYLLLAPRDQVLLIGSFGASAVLVYGAIVSPLAQPRNLIGGHVISAIIGVAVFQLAGAMPWLAAALAVSIAIAVMQATRTLHPPGGATALIAVIGSEEIHALGFGYVVLPVAVGAILMLLVALVVNNIPATRHYPEYWW